jgi:hypothetical protein
LTSLAAGERDKDGGAANTENSKQIFPEKELRGLSPNFHINEIYIFPPSVCLFCCRKICGPILGINKYLTDT